MRTFSSHLRSIIKAFFFYRRGFLYLYMRYVVAPKILSHPRPLEGTKRRDDMSMHILFGKRDFLMALWSLASFYRVMPETGQLVVHSDGTLSPKHLAAIRRLFPSARIEDTRSFLREHGTLLNAFPTLKQFRELYPKFQSKKLLDQYFLSGKPFRLVLDSDLLWFREPVDLVESLARGVPTPLMMSNHDARIHVEFIDGTRTSDEIARANSGVVLYSDAQFSLERAEEYMQRTDFMNRKFTDQACYASILKPVLFPESSYLIKGTLTEAVIMRHYTQPQREKFFCYGLNFIWKEILSPS
jgi:hypothetical protein